jgi:hypothetical protein
MGLAPAPLSKAHPRSTLLGEFPPAIPTGRTTVAEANNDGSGFKLNPHHSLRFVHVYG